MQNKSRKIITALFFVIVGVSLLGTVVSTITTTVWEIRMAIAIIFLVQGVGAWSLAKGVFSFTKLHPGIVIHSLLWLSGANAVFSVLDVIAYLTKGHGIIPTISPFWFNGFSVLLFVLWLLIGHFAAQDAQERKVCEFC